MKIVCFKNLNPFRRSNFKFQICSIHRILKRTHIRFRQNFILRIYDFVALNSIDILISSRKLNYFLSETDFDFTGKMQFRASFGFLKKVFWASYFDFCTILPLTIASCKRVNSRRCPSMPHPKKTHTFGLYSTSEQSHMKVGSKNRPLGVGLTVIPPRKSTFRLGLIKTLINQLSF